jgi:hypothetical protein
MTRFITSMGHGLPAMMPVRRLDRSKRRSPVVELGDEHGRHAVAGGAFLGHRLQHGQRLEGLGGIDHGRAVGQAAQVAHHHAEAVVERHRMHTRSPGTRRIASPTKKPLLRMLWCDSVAPLGLPVVPEVNWMLIGSSNCRRSPSLDRPARRGRGRRAGRRS